MQQPVSGAGQRHSIGTADPACCLQVVVGRTGDQMLSNEAGEVTR